MGRTTKLRNRILWAERELGQLEERTERARQRLALLVAELAAEQLEHPEASDD